MEAVAKRMRRGVESQGAAAVTWVVLQETTRAL